MKKVFNSIGQVFQQIKKDPMMLTACFTPFLVGALIKFGIPLIEKAAKFSLQPIIRCLTYFFLSWRQCFFVLLLP